MDVVIATDTSSSKKIRRVIGESILLKLKYSISILLE